MIVDLVSNGAWLQSNRSRLAIAVEMGARLEDGEAMATTTLGTDQNTGREWGALEIPWTPLRVDTHFYTLLEMFRHHTP